MCLDCMNGYCFENTTYCVCYPPYTQSFEFFTFENFNCVGEYQLACMPCDTLNSVITALYSVALVTNVFAFFGLSATFTKLRRVKRHFFMGLSLYCTIIAASIRIGDPNRWYAVDPAYTFFITYGILFPMIEIMLKSRRFVQYIQKTMMVQNKAKRQKKMVRIILYTNYGGVVIVNLIGLLPMVASVLSELQDKSLLVRISFAAAGVVFLVMTLAHTTTHNKIILDIQEIIQSKNQRDRELVRLQKTISKLRAERNGLMLIFFPTSLLLWLFTFSDAIYRAGRYIVPAGSAASGIAIFYIIFKGVRYRLWAEASDLEHRRSLLRSQSSFWDNPTPSMRLDNNSSLYRSSLELQKSSVDESNSTPKAETLI